MLWLRQLHYPPGLSSIDEAGDLVTGPVDTTASCTGNANNSVCNAGEILQWTVGTLTPGRAVQLSLSPGVLGTAVDGELIKWSAIATEDGQSLRRASVTLPIGTCNFLSDTDCDGVNDDTGNCTDVANADQRDTDRDGCGKICDADLNNTDGENIVNLSVYSVFPSIRQILLERRDAAVRFSACAVPPADADAAVRCNAGLHSGRT